MGDSEHDLYARRLRARQATLTDAWCAAIAGTSFTPYSPAELWDRLYQLTDQAIAGFVAEPFDAGSAERVGAALSGFHLTKPEVLGRTQALFCRELLKDLAPEQAIAMLPRLSGFLESLALGFGREATDTLLREQEAIRKALLSELQRAERQLRESHDHLEEEVARRTEELQDSREQWRSLIANLPDPVLTIDREGRILYVNYVRPESGLTLHDVLGQSALDLTFPDQLEPAMAALRHVFDTAESIIQEIRMPRQDGSVVWFDVHLGPVLREGQVVAALAVARDISERRKIEAALQESEERWRTLITSAPDLIYTVDGEGRILYVNRLPRESGLAPDDVIGRSICGFVAPEHRELVERALAQVFSTGGSAGYEAALRRPQGEVIWYSSHFGPLWRDGRVVAAMLISRDITDRKRIEAALQESEERWKSLVTYAPDTVLTVDAEGRILFVNHMPAESGFRTGDMIGRRISGFTVPEHREIVESALRHVFDTGESTVYESAVQRPNGTRRWFATHVGPIRQGDRVVAAMLISRDVTERKRMEEMKDNLLRDVSHELRTPLTRAQVSLEMALESVERTPVDAKAAARYGRKSLDSLRRLAAAVKSILDLSRLEAGVGAFARDTIHLSELLTQVARDIQPLLAEKGLRLALQVEETLPPIRGDRERLWRVVHNLLDNAHKFSPAGEIVLSAAKQGGEIVVGVRDQGWGILPQNLSRVFDRFFREDTGSDGVGVGLPMCKTIVETHGGRIWAESAGRGQGATFWFALPVPSEGETEPTGRKEGQASD